MPVKLENIEEGKCYVTSSGQVRQVLKIGTKITYQARGKKALRVGEKWNPAITVKAEKFAAAVDREVRCDSDPDYPEVAPG
jgi:hypothetical protein